MTVSHARATAVTSTDESAGQAGGEVPGMLEVLALVPDPRKPRGRRYALVFILAVAVACVLAGAKSFREIGDHAADLPQEVLARLGGTLHPLLRKIIAPSEKRIRTLIQRTGRGETGRGHRRLAARPGDAQAAWNRCSPRSRSTGNGCAASATGRSSCSPRCCTSRR